MAVRSSDDFIALYSQIYFACHTRHVHDPESGTKVSARQASILSHLDSVEPTPVSQLAANMGVTVSTMSIAIDRLERPGYVVRARAEADGRVRHIRLTPAGERLRTAQKVLEPRLVRAMLSRLPLPTGETPFAAWSSSGQPLANSPKRAAARIRSPYGAADLLSTSTAESPVMRWV